MDRSGPDPEFDFISRWQLATGLEEVWDALVDFRRWPEWWPGLQSVVETATGDENGIGERARSRWRGPVGYSIEFEIETVRREYLRCLGGRATGELSGTGTWHIGPVERPGDAGEAWTQVEYEWHVVATRRWMRLLNPVARPVFVYSHDHVMEAGATGLAEWLGCELREFRTGEEAWSQPASAV